MLSAVRVIEYIFWPNTIWEILNNVKFQKEENLSVDEGRLWRETDVSIEIDFGNRKKRWTCELKWGVGKFFDKHTCLWLGSLSRSRAVGGEAGATYTEARPQKTSHVVGHCCVNNTAFGDRFIILVPSKWFLFYLSILLHGGKETWPLSSRNWQSTWEKSHSFS